MLNLVIRGFDMKYLTLVFCLLATGLYAAPPIAFVVEVKGIVKIKQQPEAAEQLLKKGEALFPSSIISTSPDAYVLFRLQSGILRYIGGNTRFHFQRDQINTINRTEPQLNQILVTLGTKAHEKDPWYEESEIAVQKFKSAFEIEDFFQATRLWEAMRLPAEEPELHYLAGLAYLKTGRESKALKYLLPLAKSPHFIHREQLLASLSVAYHRLLEPRQAKLYLDLLRKEYPRSPLVNLNDTEND